MQAPPEVVFAALNDFRRWEQWSPWNDLDPEMKKTYSERSAGKGATYGWSGNDEVGTGSMTIVESTAPRHLALDLKFTAPFEAENVTTFDVEAKGSGAEVTWAMSGKNNFMAKAAALFMDMDAMVGGQFEAGLANLERVTEADHKRILAEAAAKKLAEDKSRQEAEAKAAAETPEGETDPG